ncbi:hypothetical protein AVEN_52472-1 [Araneus ventricosus]|uniref:DDE-1 domain-containing protein n=1 Tax=Araneus ventricosus TaxID=182803 RepID=A0A4Y2CXS1_ARAVE|nr:hypothetical protein AVEN_52472-1 [Araneus ventricosus]
MGQGVIRSLKCHYRKQLILRILECYDENKDCDISLLDAVVLLEKSWRLVTESTIRNYLVMLDLRKHSRRKMTTRKMTTSPLQMAKKARSECFFAK